MSFRFALHTPDDDDCGEFQTLVPNWKVDETFLTGDGRSMRIVAMLPLRKDYPESVFDGAWMVEQV